MTLLVLCSIVLGAYAPLSYASAYVEGGVGTSEAGPRFEPQVAMVCGTRTQYHAQHMTESGRWVSDAGSKVTCLNDKVDILHYCKKMYPERDITNIVESTHYYKVPNFCRVGHTNTKCKASVWVKPYRCLEGSFQSDALLVPEGCLFDHIHNQSRCWEFDRWNTTADGACLARRMTLKSFAMLLPCGIDVFSGVEFVCCPKNYKGHGKLHTMEVEEPVALPQVDALAGDPTSVPHTTTAPQEVGTRDEYFSRFDPHEEHDAFRRAEQRLEERHRDKVSKIMKEWSELEERYQDLRGKSPRGAEEFKNRMTQRFQQTVESVEAENDAEKRQLTALHQQRIVAHINEMKREAMTCYTRALDAQEPNTHKVQKCLQKLLRALNKDRHHTVSHYKHLLNSDYEAADRERDSTLQHLSDLDRMVNQSLNMLARSSFRHSDLYGKIGRLMHEYAAALRSKDTTPPELTPQPPRPQDLDDDDDDDDEDDDDQDYEDDDDQDDGDDQGEDDDDDENDGDDDEDAATDQGQDNDTHDDDDDDDDDDEEKSDSQDHKQQKDEESSSETILPQQSVESDLSTAAESSPESTDYPSSSTAVPSILQQEEAHVAHAQHHAFAQSQPGYSVIRDVSGSDSRGVYFTLAFAGVALMAAMVVGIVVLRRRNNRHPHNQGFMEVDQAVTPEERHVTNMQVNGYENPTYKYFEEK